MNVIGRVLRTLQARGPGGLAKAVYRRLARPRVAEFDRHRQRLLGTVGLEIGGPSGVFARGGLFPLYPLAARVDNCNFGDATIWEGRIEAGATFQFDPARVPGVQYIAEATSLRFAADGSYDFVASSHALEHSANPLKALHEWKRVLKSDGLIVLVLPHRDGTFDRHRPVTPLQHMIDDLAADTGEDDLTHLDEILRLHDLGRDPEAGGRDAFEARARENRHNRGLHHHVFDTRAAVRLVDHAGLQILSVQACEPFHIFIVAQKPSASSTRGNGNFFASAGWSGRSPFASDGEPRDTAQATDPPLQPLK